MWRAGIVILGLDAAGIAVAGLLYAIGAVWPHALSTETALFAAAFLLLATPILITALAFLVWARWGRTSPAGDAVAALAIVLLGMASFIAEIILIVNDFVAHSKMAL
ncbi:hypothetical protein GCM10009617_00470 [Leifsonia poae]|uniref:Uncharacterized protein n=2 Tax=Leifsonia poae TaxID=110933 RepID=A0A9W6LYD4_9MICO|nr:hypothetical protein GCM10017584_00470 [Leifsonia poae]